MKHWALGLGALLATFAGGWVVRDIDPIVHPPVPPAGLDAHESNAAVSLIGQFRTSVASWLWVRTDLYLHNGVEMRPLTQKEIENGQTGVGSSDNTDNKIADDDAIVTVIPSAEQDFRGVLGDLERETKAYKDMRHHSHNDPKIAIPLFRLMTWLDPQFVPGWITGANVIARDPRDVGIALLYLKEGLGDNPGNVPILTELGTMSATLKHDFAAAADYLEQARKFGTSLKESDGPDDRDALETAYRWLGLIYRDTGQLDKMYRVLDEARFAFPRDAVIYRLANPAPTPLTPASQKLWLQQSREAFERSAR